MAIDPPLFFLFRFGWSVGKSGSGEEVQSDESSLSQQIFITSLETGVRLCFLVK